MKKVNGITPTTNIKMKWNPPDYHRITYNCPLTLNAELLYAWTTNHDIKIG